MQIDVVSIFPDYLAPLHLSLVGKAIHSGVVELNVRDLRDWTYDRHRSVDDTPYGGGAGMVMKPEPWGEALDDLVGAAPTDARLIVLTPSGCRLDQALAEELAKESHLVVACGRYEGIDARVVEHARTRVSVDEVSIGDYVLNGGEAAALVLIEAVVRLLPGVIGNPESLNEESHSAGQDRLLEYPVYTKPAHWRGLDVPDILFSGHHRQIAEWRRARALALTRERRPDLIAEPTQIRPLAPAEVGELFTLQRACWVSEAHLHQSLAIPPLVETYDEFVEGLAHDTVLVARRDGRLIGSVRGHARPSGTWYVGRLMVAPDLQGNGLGSELLSEIEAAAPPGTTAFRLVTGEKSVQNRAFYARRGYRVLQRRGGTDTVGIVIMEKTVAP